MFLFLDSTLFSYVKGRVGSPASGGTLFQDEAVLWCEEGSNTTAYFMTTEYNRFSNFSGVTNNARKFFIVPQVRKKKCFFV